MFRKLCFGMVAAVLLVYEAGAQFHSISTSEVPPLNTALQGKQFEPLKAASREDWSKKQ
jgi:hypothetical protein